MNRALLAALLALMGGCAEYAAKSSNIEYSPRSGATDAVAGLLRVDVFPGTTVDADGQIRALPQTIGVIEATEEGLVDVGVVALREPGSLSGIITGARVTPWADSAQIPASEGAVSAQVRVELAGSIQKYTVSTDGDGFYDAIVVPSSSPYLVSVIPDDPGIPFSTLELGFRADDEALDLHLDYGVVLFGRVLTGADEPVPNVRVRAVNSHGVSSRSAQTDAGGWYVLRVQDGDDYQVVCDGRDNGRDPVLTSDPVLAEPDVGAQVDFRYPTLATTFASGRVVDTAGLSIANATVRFTATALSGYGPVGWSYQVEDTSDGNGNFGVNLVDGTYDIQIVPAVATDPSLDHGGIRLTGVASGGFALGNQTLPDLLPFSAEVVDPFGNAVGEARITCTEVGLGGRSWSAFAGPAGRVEMNLPPAALRCQVQPPGARATDLAWTTEQIDASIDDGHRFEMREGTLVTGQVRLGSEGEAYALVELRDPAGALLGSALTLGSEGPDGEPVGGFALRVDLGQADTIP